MDDGPSSALANPEWLAFATGDEARRKPAAIARVLEDEAVDHGWPTGSCIGSESELIERFAVNREILREAIRMLSARGATVMKRGAQGGLYLTQPSIETCASALATYLRAWGTSDVGPAEIAQVADPLFRELPHDYLVSRLYRQTVAAVSNQGSENRSELRGATIALCLIDRGAPISAAGLQLGSEADLCAEFNASRAVFRQALRILDDLGMLLVRRGRGGGYLLQRPSSIGMSRRLFALFASHQLGGHDVVPGIWALNLVNLRLTTASLHRVATVTRLELCDRLEALLTRAPEPHRWALLMHEFAQTANSNLVRTLQSCLIAYLARIGPHVARYDSVEGELREHEQHLIAALRRADDDAAERAHRHAQSCLSRVMAALSNGEPRLPQV